MEQALLLARMLNCCAAVILGCVALLICASGRWLLFADLLLPTGLSLRASCSQDAWLLALAGLLMALLGRPLAARRLPSYAEWIATAATLVLLVGARLPYLPLAAAAALQS